MGKIKIIQIKSNIKRIKKQKLTLKALGLRGIGKEVIHEDKPNIFYIPFVALLIFHCLNLQ